MSDDAKIHSILLLSVSPSKDGDAWMVQYVKSWKHGPTRYEHWFPTFAEAAELVADLLAGHDRSRKTGVLGQHSFGTVQQGESR